MNSFVLTVYTLTLVVIVTLNACSLRKPVVPVYKWDTSELLDRTLRFKDSDRTLVFSFGEKNLVGTTIGENGTYTAPLLYWNIAQDGALNITEDGKKVLYRLVKLEKLENGFKVDCNGEVQIYSYSSK